MFAIGPAAFGSHAVCLPVGSELRSSKPGVREPYCSPRGVLRLNEQGRLFREATIYGSDYPAFRLRRRKKKGLVRLANPKLVETLRIGFCQTF
jgi:hypothetical protein